MKPIKKQGSLGFLVSQAAKLSRRNRTETVLVAFIAFLVTLCIYLELSAYYAPSSSPRLVEPDHVADFPDISTRRRPRREELPTQAAPIASHVVEPQLSVFLQRIRLALSPFTNQYVKTIPVSPLYSGNESLLCKQMWSFAVEDQAFAPCAGACAKFATLGAAKQACEADAPACVGVTQLQSTGEFELRLRNNGKLEHSGGERSWRRIGSACPEREGEERATTAMMVWNTFHDVVEGTLQDEGEFHLLNKLYSTREDGSIFISISSYRDNTCAATLKKAFERASNPELLSAGIVQQNCVHPDKCYTGTGWANTRAWVKSEHPDVDCALAFCESELGKPHCDAGRIRILRLDEIDAFGPFFSRFVNSKLWRGENYYLQIDAHTDFRSDWDSSMRAQMLATSSYPKSVISNYPLGGSPSSKSPWKALSNPLRDHGAEIPSALCGCSFEHAGQGRYTVRLSQSGRHFASNQDEVKRSLFVAAGFFIAHGEFVNEIGFDPFMPFLFMGEEIALSIRFYTNGYNIYAPSADVLKHEYVRKESPKFWESVGYTYSRSNIHNELTDLIIQRVQYLVTFPEADRKDKVSPSNLLTLMDRFGLGTRRTAQLFLRISGMDLANRKQHVPSWCTTGGSPEGEEEEEA